MRRFGSVGATQHPFGLRVLRACSAGRTRTYNQWINIPAQTVRPVLLGLFSRVLSTNSDRPETARDRHLSLGLGRGGLL
jgi:hypothetical protein